MIFFPVIHLLFFSYYCSYSYCNLNHTGTRLYPDRQQLPNIGPFQSPNFTSCYLEKSVVGSGLWNWSRVLQCKLCYCPHISWFWLGSEKWKTWTEVQVPVYPNIYSLHIAYARRFRGKATEVVRRRRDDVMRLCD